MTARVASSSSVSSRSSVRSRGGSSVHSVGSATYEGTNSLTSSVQVREETSTFGSLGGSMMGDGYGNGTSTVGSSSSAGGGGSTHDTESGTNSLTSSMHMPGEESTCSSYTNELSLPSSFASSMGERSQGGAAKSTGVTSRFSNDDSDSMRTRELATGTPSSAPSSHNGSGSNNNNDGAMEVYHSSGQLTGGGDSVASEGSDSANSEDRLALRISKETKPMHHLLRLLKDIDDRNGNEHGDAKGRAVASLMKDFEQEVSVIEHRIKDENLIMNGEQPPLPPNWIALEDPDSGDVYYANETTGDTQWERPGLMSELEDKLQLMTTGDENALMRPSDMHGNFDDGDTQGSNMNNDFEQGSNRSNNYEQNQSSNTSNNYDRRSTNGSNASNNDDEFDGSRGDMGNAYETKMHNSHTSNNNNQQQGNSTSSNNFEGSHSNMTNTMESSLTDSNRSNLLTDLAPDWMALEDPDTGETYYANEVTGESTWDKPEMPQSLSKDEESIQTDEDGGGGELPPDWVALEDADSGDTYYLNQATMETTWDRPGGGDSGESVDVGENDEGSRAQQSVNDNDNDDASEQQGDLPPGWEAILDSSSGDHYYCNEETGETTWDRPELDVTSRGQHGDVSVDEDSHDQHEDQHQASYSESRNSEPPIDEDDNGRLPPGWFEAEDEDSGDKYYCNEATGETTWDFPTEPVIEDDGMSNPNQAPAGEVNEGDDDLLPGWFGVTDTSSGDLYYCNEETGETTWDPPTRSSAATAPQQDIGDVRGVIQRPSINDDVYEDDSVTSSQY